MKYWGFECNRVAHEIMEVDLDSQVVILNEPIFDEIFKQAVSRSDFEHMVLEAEGKTVEEWRSEHPD